MADAPIPPLAAPVLTRLHYRRLREIYRSAGWPCLDAVEVELLAAGLLERMPAPGGREWLRLTQAGLEVLARALQGNRAAYDAHEALVERVAQQLARDGRLAWRGLALRARVESDAVDLAPPEPLPLMPGLEAPPCDAAAPGRWCIARPDVYSVRHTSVEAYLEPVVHEIKVRRSDLLADLRRPAKRAAYLSLCRECYYVIAAGIAQPEEIPPECGVLVAHGERFEGPLELLRAAPKRPAFPDGRLPFGIWMALARATPVEPDRLGEQQQRLGDGAAA
ncbi:hypothetical protein OOT46_11575 [Aquabacterium sp. A7-Y]|uniref:hypothetical protein n=1 Tax=Aquabacterium sp. A7-Y TaxID=1349605 RepID=UPI00223E8E97|nr:hypothetical protein [Aquabacterium sp. A7-Y]MCW7538480.1 hypothetical protein [Aquabacterium sp. A7-Y]